MNGNHLLFGLKPLEPKMPQMAQKSLIPNIPLANCSNSVLPMLTDRRTDRADPERTRPDPTRLDRPNLTRPDPTCPVRPFYP